MAGRPPAERFFFFSPALAKTTRFPYSVPREITLGCSGTGRHGPGDRPAIAGRAAKGEGAQGRRSRFEGAAIPFKPAGADPGGMGAEKFAVLGTGPGRFKLIRGERSGKQTPVQRSFRSASGGRRSPEQAA